MTKHLWIVLVLIEVGLFTFVHGLETLSQYERVLQSTRKLHREPDVSQRFNLETKRLLEGAPMYDEWFGEGDGLLATSAAANVAFFDRMDSEVPREDGDRTASHGLIMVNSLLSLVRHWSAEGKKLRQDSHDKILSSLEQVYGSDYLTSELRILLPGAGNCRLAFDLAQYSSAWQVEAIEQDETSIRVAVFLMNNLFGIQSELYPSLHITNNWMRAQDRFQGYTVPDVSPSEFDSANDVGLVHGSFPDYYLETIEDGSFEGFHTVVTCFFLDAIDPLVNIAGIHHVLDVTRMQRCMNKDTVDAPSVWINNGPLVYPEYANAPSNQLPLDMILHAIESAGFTIHHMDTHPCNYEGLPNQGEQRVLTCVHFAAVLTDVSCPGGV